MTDVYEFIDSCRDANAKYAYPVKKMCLWSAVSSSGFFAWARRPQSATAARREHLATLVVAIFEVSDQTYGYRRVHAQLARQGEQCGPELVRQIMRDASLITCQPRPWRHSLTEADGREHHMCASPWAAPAFATTMPWPNHSSPRCRTNESAGPFIRPASTPAKTSPATSSSGTTPSGSTPASATTRPKKPSTIGQMPRKQRKVIRETRSTQRASDQVDVSRGAARP